MWHTHPCSALSLVKPKLSTLISSILLCGHFNRGRFVCFFILLSKSCSVSSVPKNDTIDSFKTISSLKRDVNVMVSGLPVSRKLKNKPLITVEDISTRAKSLRQQIFILRKIGGRRSN